jgi:hypothetical protein
LSHPDLFDPAPGGRWTGGSAVLPLLGAALLPALETAAAAQAPAPAAAPPPTVVTRSLTLEIIIVVAMVAAALFAVCRSSRRN